tara:strand:+ start:107 stop:523 length:417 start_codon:yes stop_codon:yes gene_type:complete
MKFFLLLYFFILAIFSYFLNPQKNKADSIKMGGEIYNDLCYRCHGLDGIGQDDMIPPLKSSDYLLNNIELSIAGLKYGLKGEIIVNGKKYNGYMAYQGLENDEIADVMNYILNQWGNNSKKFITTLEVDKIKKSILEK